MGTKLRLIGWIHKVCSADAYFRPSEHPEKTSNNKKVLYFIRKNGFRLLLSTAAKMVGAYMACLIFKKVKKRKWHSSNCGMIIFWCTCRTILHSQSSHGHQHENGYCHDDAKCHDYSQSTRLSDLPTSRMKSSSYSRVEYTWCCTERRIGLRHGTRLCGS